MAKNDDAKPRTKTVPGLFITTSPDRRVLVAGEFWAGASHVPASNFTEAQVVELRTSKLLDVKDQDIEVPDDGA